MAWSAGYGGTSMLSRFRQRSALVAALLAAFLATVGTPHSTDPGHDSDRAIVVVPHNEADHQLRASGLEESGTHDTHCVLCHFARSFRPRTDTRTVSQPPAPAGAHVSIAIFGAVAAALVAQPPLRAPPPSPKAA